MSVDLFICEKRDQATKVIKAFPDAKACGSHWECDGGRVLVTHGRGHLVEMLMPEDYDEKHKAKDWDLLPFIPDPFRWRPKTDKDGFAARQLKAIAALARRADRIVIATDPDREGEYICYEILRHIGWRGPLARFWTTDLTVKAVKKAVANLRPAAETRPLFEAAMARAMADFIIGISLSRGANLRLRAEGGASLSVGRVQTAVLALMVRQERKIRAFRPEDYFELTAQVETASGERIVMRHAPPPDKRIMDRRDAEDLRDRAEGRGGPISVTEEAKKQLPPELLDLSRLQQECNRRFGWSADKTLEVAQRLYDGTNGTGEALLSYPRAECKQLPETHIDNIDTILDILLDMPEFRKLDKHLGEPVVRKRYYDDEKVSKTSHYAIVPTTDGADFDKLDDDEFKVYLLVARYYLAAHMPDHEYLAVVMTMEAGGVPFRTAGRVPTKHGWKRAFMGGGDDEGVEPEGGEDGANADGAEEMPDLPEIPDGERGTADPVRVDEKTTQPPKRFTEARLLAAMQNIANHIGENDPEAKARLRATSGLGTSATRAETIKKLKGKDYVRVEKRELVPTDTGMTLIEAVEKTIPSLADPVMTARWEDGLEAIAQGRLDVPRFLAGISKSAHDGIHALRYAEGVERVRLAPPAQRGGKGGARAGAGGRKWSGGAGKKRSSGAGKSWGGGKR